jgi:EAL domain-containing protein (putative c-di-GMP-specific phosphodiesterase class I)
MARGGTPFLGRSRAPATAPRGAPGPVDPALALTQAGSAVYTWHLGSGAIDWSPNAAEVLGVIDLEALARGDAFSGLIEPGSGPIPAEAILTEGGADAGDGVPYRFRYALRIRSDRLLMVEDTGRWYADARGRPALLRGTVRTDGRSGAQAALTAGLKARTALLARIFDDVLESQRSCRAVTLVVGLIGAADADADEVMASVAERVRPLMRRRDQVLPYGPDRFALALSSCRAADAEQALSRIFALIGHPRLRLGAATAPDHALDAPELLRRAEEAANARDSGFGVYRLGAAKTPSSVSGTSAAELLDALNERRLLAAYRPVIDTRTRKRIFRMLAPRIVGCGQSVIIGDIGHAARESGLSTLVDARLVELAADALARHPDERIALAISPVSLEDGEWLHGLAAHLGARRGIESRLVVAVHEGALVHSTARGRLDALKALGVGIMLAVFGAGHAGARHLKSLPIDILRIDGALTQTLARSTDDRLLVRRLVDLGQHLGIATLAEWVDDEPIASLLAEWGVDYIEGPLAGEATLSLDRPTKARRSDAA